MLGVITNSDHCSLKMPQPRRVTVVDSDTEVISEVTTSRRTKRGTKLNTGHVSVEQPPPPKTEKGSGSRIKSKKQVQTSLAEQEIDVPENNDIAQMYEFIGDKDLQLVDDQHPNSTVGF
jgi:hypothetical protein